MGANPVIKQPAGYNEIGVSGPTKEFEESRIW